MEPRRQRGETRGRCVREALPAELDALAGLLAHAFERDPAYRWMLPDDVRWRRVAPGLFRAILELFAATGLVLTDADGRGAALWNPPEPRPRSLRQSLAFSLGLCARLGWASARLARLARALAALHPREPHWYLGVVGVDPEWRRRGVGASLLAPILARCDAEQLPAYLETAAAENLPFYRGNGFEVIGEASVPSGPRIWAMRRPPRVEPGREPKRFR